MSILGIVLLVFYLTALFIITIYCLLQFHLLIYYKRTKWQNRNKVEEVKEIKEFPFVTIQLPVFNEMYVVERLIDNIMLLDYPIDKFEVHVLDDSTDQTVEISRKKVEEYKEKGFNIELLTRTNRQGYKAGALKEGMKSAKGEFIAIFDADFLPRKDFLRKTIPHFLDPKIGVVQTRWEHINQGYSLLTELQAFQLNVHFTVEQYGRDHGNLMLQFNGTAGLWRKQTIEEAGGWEADTLTEDLDLSYRAQLKGWKILFLENITAPAELPAEMNGLKSQQHRWMKGGAETAKKMLPTIWKSDLGMMQKLHATVHLLSSSVFICVFIIGVFSVPLVFFLSPVDLDEKYFGIFLISLLAIMTVYYTANVQTAWKKESFAKMLFKFIFLFPVFLALSMGLSLHNTIAVIQGYIGKQSPFVRTPKFNINQINDSFKKRNYLAKNIDAVTIIEGLLTIYFAIGIYLGIIWQEYTFLLFHMLLVYGYGSIFYLSIKHLNND